MSFLDFLFRRGNEADELKKELEQLRNEIKERHDLAQRENEQILSVIASFENDTDTLRHDMTERVARSEKSGAKMERRLALLERLAETLKVAGRLSVQNHDSLQSMEPALRRLDMLEKAMREHLASKPEVIISKDVYSEEISEFKRRLDALENKELIIIGQEKKKQKKPWGHHE